ncbi:hypothetical protein [Streptomyces sp. NPDC047071]|uniref:hypothetical protein n=1 Tax=Streptomyces sp. NPDC047071 TaxID=3154808 RepID=UPI003454B629
MAVRAGGESLGAIWVVDSGSLAEDAEAALAQGAATAALLLLRARAAREQARDRHTELARRLLDGAPDATTAARRRGWDALRVAAFVLDAAASVPDAERTSLRLLDVVRLQCEARYGQHACVLLDGAVYALLPAPGARGGASGTAGRRHRSSSVVSHASLSVSPHVLSHVA